MYRPINSVISSREQSCVNDLIISWNDGKGINKKCNHVRDKKQCIFHKGNSKK